MNTSLIPKSALTTQEQTPNSSHIFMPNQKLSESHQYSCFSSSQQCIRAGQTAENSRPSSPSKTNQSQIISDGSQSKTIFRPNIRSNSGQGRDSGFWILDSSKFEGTPIRAQSYYSKQVIREQEEEIRQLNKWVQILKKQCKMYEQVISKLDQKITHLTKQNQSLTTLLKRQKVEHQNHEKSLKILELQQIQKINKMEQNHKNQMFALKEKVNNVMQMYGQLESEFNKGEIQWNVWKQKWNKEKQKYVQQIQYLKDFIDKNISYERSRSNWRVEVEEFRRDRDWSPSNATNTNRGYQKSRNNSQYRNSGSRY